MLTNAAVAVVIAIAVDVAFYSRCRRRRRRSYVNKSGCSFVIGWDYYCAHRANETCHIECIRMKMGHVSRWINASRYLKTCT